MVTRQGTIRDPFVIEDQCTNSMFRRPSLQAALKFKYKPRVIDGQAVEVPGVQKQVHLRNRRVAPGPGLWDPALSNAAKFQTRVNFFDEITGKS